MDAFFERFFPQEGDALDGYHQAIRARLSGTRRLLDLGCGANTDLAAYREANREVWGVDFQTHPELAHPTWFRLLGRDGSVPFPGDFFDGIACRWVLEHVADPGHFLTEVRRLLRPGGWFIALTVNGGHYVSWLSRLVDLLPHAAKQRLVRRLYGRPLHDTFPTWYRLNTGEIIRRNARPADLHLTQLTRFANPDYFSFSPFLRRSAIVADWLLEKAGTGLGRLYLVVTLHKPALAVSSQHHRPAAA
jgi:SAM-dependent methyltransferase